MDIKKRLKDAGVEAVQSEVVRWFQEHRSEIASMILDWVPDAHTHSAAMIGQWLPRIAQVFKVATPEDPIWDTMDDVVQDLAAELKKQSVQRAQGDATTSTPPPPHSSTPTAKVDTTSQYARFLLTAATLEERQVDALLAWHVALGEEDKERLYYLCSQADDVNLAALLKQPLKAIKTSVTRIQLPKKQEKPKTYLEFREEIRSDGPLTLRVNSFLAAKGITPARFWKLIQKFYGNRVKDKAEFALLMNLGDDEIYAFLHLAETLKDLFGSAVKFSGNLGKAVHGTVGRGDRGFSSGLGTGLHLAGQGIGAGARVAGTGIGQGARVVGDGIVAAGVAVRDTAVTINNHASAGGLWLQANYPVRPARRSNRVWNWFVNLHS